MLEIERLYAGYDARTSAVRDFSLFIEAGKIASIIGPNGCGKSTLLRCVAGLLKPHSGRVVLNGDDIAQLTPRARARKIALLPQNFEISPSLSVEELVMLGRTPHLSHYGSPSRKDFEVVERALEQTSTAQFKNRDVAKLSGGERQRVLLARALAQEAQILLLDEPTSNLDLKYQYEILKLVYSLARAQNLTVIIVFHQINLAASMSDMMALLNGDGSTRALGKSELVMTRENLESVYGVPLEIFESKTGRPQARADWNFGKTPSDD